MHSCSISPFLARIYIDAGIKLLGESHWERQYPLSLDLFEMSASVSCMSGDTVTMSTCLDEILANVRSFDDSLKASSLLVKLLASGANFTSAIDNCVGILSKVNVPRVIQYNWKV